MFQWAEAELFATLTGGFKAAAAFTLQAAAEALGRLIAGGEFVIGRFA